MDPLSSNQKPEETTEHDALWALIPWYVNGSLSKAETDRVEAYASASTEFTAEIERQSALAVGIVEQDIEDADDAAARSWANLQDQIAADVAARAPGRAAGSWWSAWLPNTQGGMALAGLAVVAVLVGVLALGPSPQTGDEGFVTLTTGAESDQPVIKFQLAEGIPADTVARIFAEHDLVLLDQPSSNGVRRALAPQGTDLKAAAAKLMTDPAIVFAAPE